MNNITLVGRATKDIEIKATPSGTMVANGSIAVDRGRKGPNGDKLTDFFNVSFFGKTAEIASQYIKKGDMFSVSGRMENDRWVDKDGNKRDGWRVQVDRLSLIGGRRDSQGSDFPAQEEDIDQIPF